MFCAGETTAKLFGEVWADSEYQGVEVVKDFRSSGRASAIRPCGRGLDVLGQSASAFRSTRVARYACARTTR